MILTGVMILHPAAAGEGEAEQILDPLAHLHHGAVRDRPLRDMLPTLSLERSGGAETAKELMVEKTLKK